MPQRDDSISRGKTGRDGEAAVYDLSLPKELCVPFVYNSPHSGRFYPDDLMTATRLDDLQIRASEDCFVDMLFAGAPRLGAPLLKAVYPRAYVDTNREPYELDPAMFRGKLPDFVTRSSVNINSGLGTIPRLVSPEHVIYEKKLEFTDVMGRIERVYMPYHRGLLGLINLVENAFGGVIVIDCHSMPSQALPRVSGAGGKGGHGVDIVLGDRYGQACSRALSDLAESLFRELGYSVGRNDPYAGGYNVMHYGRPADGRHVLQLEINRALYVNEATLEPTANFDRLADDLATWMSGMHREAANILPELGLKMDFPRAAE